MPTPTAKADKTIPSKRWSEASTNFNESTVEMIVPNYDEDCDPTSARRMNPRASIFGAIDVSNPEDFDDESQEANESAESRLFALCDMASQLPRVFTLENTLEADAVEQTWQTIREWIKETDEEECVLAAQYEGDFGSTALHLACKSFNPPFDIIEKLIDYDHSKACQVDDLSWLPIHYACANGASMDVLTILVEAYPEGLLIKDKRGRTPLHFTVGRTPTTLPDAELADLEDEGEKLSEIVKLLCSSGASKLCDCSNMLPLHYACAYGTHKPVIQTLFDSFPESIYASDNNGRTCLHFVMSNVVFRPVSSGVVQMLIGLDEKMFDNKRKRLVDKNDHNGQTPLHLLSTQAKRLAKHDGEQAEPRVHVEQCMKVYLDAFPQAGIKFVLALSSLPEWLSDTAVLHPHVQKQLNREMAKRFPTSLLLLDFIMLLMILVSFSFVTSFGYQADSDSTRAESSSTRLLYIGVIYFSLRELIQMISYIKMGTFSAWYTDSSNLLDVAIIVLVLVYTYMIQTDLVPGGPDPLSPAQEEFYQLGMGLTFICLYLGVIFVLKNLFLDFAVFLSGILHVVSQLVTFLITLIIFLFAFAQMLVIVFVFTERCPDPSNKTTDQFFHCTFRLSLLRSYSMMMGEVDDNYLNENYLSRTLYILYGLIIMIILSNMLIAIVTAAYEVIRNEKAAIVFWKNRLDFITESYSIRQNGRKLLRREKKELEMNSEEQEPTLDTLEKLYNTLMEYYEDLGLNTGQVEYYTTLVLRIFVTIFIVMWMVIGLFSLGTLWPIQFREKLTGSSLTQSVAGDFTFQISDQLMELRNETRSLRMEIEQFKRSENIKVDEIKENVEGLREELMEDAVQVKELMRSLLDMRRSS